MRTGAVRQSIRFKADPSLRVRPGQTVSLNVVKHLIGNKWAVSVAGRVYPAVSSVTLKPGQRLTATVEVSANRVILHLEDARSPALQDILDRAGLPQDAIARAVVMALLRQGRPLDPRILQAMMPHVRRHHRSPRKAARTLAVIHEKGLSLESPGLSDLLALLMFEEEPWDDHRQSKRDSREDQEPGVSLEQATTATDNGSALSLFNSLRKGDTSWVVIPFRYDGLEGTIRLLMDSTTGVARRLVLETAGPSGRWSFITDGRHLTTYTDPGQLQRKIRTEYGNLRAKLQNQGVKTDDSIREISAFDGYSSDDDQDIRGVDALG